jgi:hypothetical protein
LSQRIVLELLKELGGIAKTRETSNLAKIKYPDSCLYEFVGHKLECLASWGYAKYSMILAVAAVTSIVAISLPIIVSAQNMTGNMTSEQNTTANVDQTGSISSRSGGIMGNAGDILPRH